MKIAGNIKSTVKLKHSLLVAATVTTLFITIVAGLLMYFGNTEESKGQSSDDSINPGKIICKFSWKYDDPLRADIGNFAKSINNHVLSGHAADAAVGGLEPVAAGKDIRLMLKASSELNAAGLDISVKYRADEMPGGSFYSRGTGFIFGIRKGALAVTYTLKSVDGKERTFSEITNYEIPLDARYRTYRFIYTEWNGKAEIFVNNVPVWTRQHANGQNLSWNETEDILVGRNIYAMKSGGSVLDDLVIKSTYKQQELPMSLLGFLTEVESKEIKLTWVTRSESDNKGFAIERSDDAIKFVQIGFVKGAGNSNVVNVYEFKDIQPMKGLCYYRLKPLNYSGDSTILPIVAQKYLSDDKQKASIKTTDSNP